MTDRQIDWGKIFAAEMSRKQFLVYSAGAVASAFGVVGLVREIISHAATATASVEPENGTGTSTVVDDTSASGGKAIRFGSNPYPLTKNSAGKLLGGGRATRISGANAYDLVITDNVPGQSGTANLNTHSQVDNMLSAMVANNQNVFRCHTIFISYGKPTSNMPSLGTYNETVLKQADYVIAKAHEKGLYVMAPLVDRWNYYHGGGVTFAQMVTGNSGATITDFLTNSTVRTQFKNYVSTLLNRTNTVNGLKWKDDPALAIIETGNEVWDSEFQAFHTDMSAWIKANFPAKLVADGSAASGNYPRSWALNDANTDIVGCHFYDDHRMDISTLSSQAASAAAAGKAYVIGEYDWTDTSGNSPGGKSPQTSTTRAQWLAAIENDGNIQGDLYWAAFTGDNSVSDHGDGYQLYLDSPRNSEQASGKAAFAPHHWTMRGAPASSTLTDTAATAVTVNLHNYLKSVKASNKILTGQQVTYNDYTITSEQNFTWLYQNTGKLPAIGAFDFMRYTPSRVQNGDHGIDTDRAISWWNTGTYSGTGFASANGSHGGIVAFCWHWNAPNGTSANWWEWTNANATNFRPTALSDTSSGGGRDLINRDIDTIATELKKLRDAGVPVLWRPLHEPNNGWFWWGGSGSGPYKQLWQYMYDRLTNYHGLHNLIWVWSANWYPSNNYTDWYPGDSYVDISGFDSYDSSANNHNPLSSWYTPINTVSSKQLVAVTECGPIPDPAQMHASGNDLDWLWFTTWGDSDGNHNLLGSQNTSSYTNTVYNLPNVITRDKLPDWRNGNF